ISKDNWVKHEEAAASYAYLKAAVEGFVVEADNILTLQLTVSWKVVSR
ncbi:hypothetical protein Tco_0549926, partial [Tanacetum coccineum]